MGKVMVNLEGRREPPIEFELNIQEEILPQVETICLMLNISQDELHKYTIRYEKKALSDLVRVLSSICNFPFVF